MVSYSYPIIKQEGEDVWEDTGKLHLLKTFFFQSYCTPIGKCHAHGRPEDLLASFGLDAAGVASAALERLP